MGFSDIGGLVYEDNRYKVHKIPFQYFNKRLIRDINQRAFNRELIDYYFRLLEEKEGEIYYESQLFGLVSLIPKLAEGVPAHMVTLAVLPEHRRKGVGSALIYAALDDYKKLNWRSKLGNGEANNLYAELVNDGLADTGEPFVGKEGIIYNPYWINHTSEDKKKSLEHMMQLPNYFK